MSVLVNDIMTEINNSKETKANMQLIATAPDLLKALKECITSDGAACYRLKKEKCRLEAINQIAFAAIAKAEGSIS